MAEIRTVTTLKSKRDEIVASIKLYERQLEQARADLAHINAVIRVFEATGDPKDMPRYVDVHRLFGRREKWDLCEAALSQNGEMTTKELAQYVVRAKGFDESDAVLLRAVTQQLVQSLRMQEKRGRVRMAGKRKGICVWESNAGTERDLLQSMRGDPQPGDEQVPSKATY